MGDLFVRLADTPWQIAMVLSGGGSGAVGICFRRAGASVNFVEANIPYSRASLESYLGAPPFDGYASVDTAQQAATVARSRAIRLGNGNEQRSAGLALLAVLPTEPSRQDGCRVVVALQTANESKTWVQSIDKATDGERHDRSSAESIADHMVIVAIEHLLSL
ncbi:hypothetical protein Poly51_27230 [Rubripirellula tenax]|uniref:CinA C-terminal domain-containing protein n=1 Tax=Rubripirellula tenax TaxID=2528015 RepID=A0A5C6F9I1_9BACT|nr:hypothetical protein Poly51_27230 [Rubripirellula tenax]